MQSVADRTEKEQLFRRNEPRDKRAAASGRLMTASGRVYRQGARQQLLEH